MLNVTCNRTGFVIVEAFPTKHAYPVAEFLYKRVICVFGGICVRVSDNGREFRNKIQEELARGFGYQLRHTTPYHPQGNGASESSNKRIIAALCNIMKHNCNEKGISFDTRPHKWPRNWDLLIHEVAMYLNARPNIKTQMSPTMIIFRKRNPQLSKITGLKINDYDKKFEDWENPKVMKKWAEQSLARALTMDRLQTMHMKAHKVKVKEAFDRKLQDFDIKPLNVGDKVKYYPAAQHRSNRKTFLPMNGCYGMCLFF